MARNLLGSPWMINGQRNTHLATNPYELVVTNKDGERYFLERNGNHITVTDAQKTIPIGGIVIPLIKDVTLENLRGYGFNEKVWDKIIDHLGF